MELARLSAKGQMTLPKKVRDAVHLSQGDLIAIDVEGGRITLRKLTPAGDLYLKGVEESLSEWRSSEDENAWRDL